MAFAIKFTDEPDEFPFDDPNTPAAVGEIIFGDFRETFVASLFEWDRKTYKAQWTTALRELLNGADRASLITEYISPTHSSKLEWWPLYRGEGELIHVQNHILWYDQLDRDFRVGEASRFLRDRSVQSEDGAPLSEWTVTLADIRGFLTTAGGR